MNRFLAALRPSLLAVSALVWTLAPVVAGPVPPIVLHTTTQAYDSVRYEAAYMIADAWRELGLEVEVAPTEFSELIDLVYQYQEFDAAILGWSGRLDRLDPQFFLGLFDSRQTGLGSNNASGYANPEFDALYDEQARTFDPDDRAAVVGAAQALAVADAPMAVLSYRDEVVAYNRNTFDSLRVNAGDGLYSEWNLLHANPLTARRQLRIGGPQAPDSLNPLASTSVWGWKWMRMYYDSLLRLSPDGEPMVWAAREVEALNDTTIRVTLRPDMIFHDGEPVTAHDVAFAFTYFVDQAYTYFNAYLAPLDRVEVMGDQTVLFHLNQPSATFANIALSQIPILPRHIWQDIESPGSLDDENTPTIGSGPFRFETFERGWAMSIAKFEDHFHADEIAVSGVNFSFYPDMRAVLGALMAREVDFTAWQFETWQIPAVEDIQHLEIVTAPDFGFQHLTFNTRREPFDSTAFRRALTHAIDRERIINALLEGRAEIGSSVIAPVNAFWHNPDVERIEFDMNQAYSELEAAGFSWDSGGRLQLPGSAATQ